MNLRTLFIVCALVLASAPFGVHAQSAEELQQQVQALLSRITALQQQIGATPSVSGSNPSVTLTTNVCPLTGVSLKKGSNGKEVERLQQFLARDSEVYPEGKVTGYFGALTEAAVQRWQAKNNIVSSGSADTTGYGVVGPRTAAAISVMCASTAGQVSQSGVVGVSAPVGGYIQVTPVSGPAPLQVAVQATVNTTNSCVGATYTLDYGDGSIPSQIAVPVGNCTQLTQALGHTYQYGGTYKLTLSAGGHSTSATVTVSGPPAPSNAVGSPTTARGTISAFVTSGPAPFTTTFYISCGAGIAYNVVFGDGKELGSAGVADSTCTGSLQAVQHTYTSPGGYTAQLVIFVQQPNGTIIPVNIANVNVSAGGGSSDASGLTTMALTPNIGGDPLHIQASFDVSNCQAYTVAWGDGQTSGATPACTGASSVVSVDHVYQVGGSYTVKLTRGSRIDSVAVSITK